jgi:hypothetical protein
MNNDEARRIRQFFEAALGDLARSMDCNQRDFRQGFKYALRLMREIEKSTDELPVEVLEGMAKAIQEDYRKLNAPPPPNTPNETYNDSLPPPPEHPYEIS